MCPSRIHPCLLLREHGSGSIAPSSHQYLFCLSRVFAVMFRMRAVVITRKSKRRAIQLPVSIVAMPLIERIPCSARNAERSSFQAAVVQTVTRTRKFFLQNPTPKTMGLALTSPDRTITTNPTSITILSGSV